MLAPSEVGQLSNTLTAVEKKAAELNLVQQASAPFAGVDLHVDGLELTTQTLGDGYAKVTVDAGTITASTHKAQFSPLMQKVLRDTQDNSASADLAKLGARADLPTFVVAVHEDGGWYVSAGYTALEYVREAQHLPAADFGSGLRVESTLGADSPDAAAQGVIRALAANDYVKAMSLVPPDEIPFYDYRAALTTLAQRNPSHSSVTIDSLSTNADVHGDTARVSVTASGTTDGGKWSWANNCYNPPPTSDSSKQYIGQCGSSPGRGTFGFVGFDSSRVPRLQITAVKRDGRWFVSPVGTALDVVDQWISSLTRTDIYAFLGIPQYLPADGTLALGQPVAISKASAVDVLSFDGHKGEQLLGLETEASSSYEIGAQLYDAEGQLVDNGDLFGGLTVTLPSDGTYKLVFMPYFRADFTITVWDAADAPAAAKHPSDGSCASASGNSSETLTQPANSTNGVLGIGGSTSQKAVAVPPVSDTVVTPTSTTPTSTPISTCSAPAGGALK